MEITAAVARAVGAPFAIETISIEEPRDNEVLVRLVATGKHHRHKRQLQPSIGHA